MKETITPSISRWSRKPRLHELPAVVLRAIGTAPENCYAVDCYWLKDDVYFVEVISHQFVPHGTVGFWAKRSFNKPWQISLSAVIEEPFVTREVFHRVLRGFDRSNFRILNLTDTYVPVKVPAE